jgi:hypothetical protein
MQRIVNGEGRRVQSSSLARFGESADRYELRPCKAATPQASQVLVRYVQCAGPSRRNPSVHANRSWRRDGLSHDGLVVLAVTGT